MAGGVPGFRIARHWFGPQWLFAGPPPGNFPRPRGAPLGGESPARSQTLFLFAFGVLLDVIDGVFYGGDFFRVFIGNFDPEILLKSHYQLDRVERVGAQVV